MLQSNDSLPVVERRPPPWHLRGSAWLVAMRGPSAKPDAGTVSKAGHAPRCWQGFSYLMFVDYKESNCGPYRELLYIPGTAAFADGHRYLTISRILVSTWESVVNGRLNWGIPKDRADFDVDCGASGRDDRIRVLGREGEICELRFRVSARLPSLPVSTALLPTRLRTIAQEFDGRTYYCTPAASGRVRPGRLLSWRFDERQFPDLSHARLIVAARVTALEMTFPVPRTATGVAATSGSYMR